MQLRKAELPVGRGRRRRDEIVRRYRPITATSKHGDGGPFGMEAAVGPLQDEHSAQERAAEDADIGAGLDQAGAAKHLVWAQDAAAGWRI